jgi:uncharacterized membrane protein
MVTKTNAGKSWALRANLLLLSISRRWLAIATVILGVYITLPFAAPTLMHLGLRGPGELIYTLYSPFCHQFAFRSFFLYGEQAIYPRAIAGLDTVPFEIAAANSETFREIFSRYARTIPQDAVTPDTLTPFSPALQFAAREYRGDEQMGYKMTLCARDISTYIALFAGTLIYRFVRRRLRPVPLLIYLILGLAPIGLDGFSQLLSYPPFELWPPRETEPVFRVLTGALFGLMNAWLGFPYLEMSFQDTRRQIEDKLRRAGIQG